MRKLLIIAMLLGANLTATAQSDHTPISDPTRPLPTLSSLQDEQPLTLKVPTMHRFTTDKGMTVLFTPIKELPMVDISLLLDGGSASQSQIKPDAYGLANLTAIMMTQGTQHLDEDSFAQRVESLGVQLRANANTDTFEISMRSLSDKKTLTPALELFFDMIANPRFDDKALTRTKAQLAIAFERAKQNPSTKAGQAFLQAVYGTHPYAVSTLGNEQGVAMVGTQDLHAYHARHVVASNAHLTITGNLSLSQAQKIANDLDSLLPKGTPIGDLPPVSAFTPKHIHIDHDSTQTHVIIGHLAGKVGKDLAYHQRQTDFNLGNAVLAGADFNARLMTKIRKEGGFTYGISGGSNDKKERGTYSINFSTQGDKAEQAIKQTLATITDTLATGITADELALARTSRKHSYPMTLATNSATHHMAIYLNQYGLPDEYLTDYLQRLDKGTLEDINQSLKSNIRPNEFIIITVGKVKPDLSEFFKEMP